MEGFSLFDGCLIILGIIFGTFGAIIYGIGYLFVKFWEFVF